MRQPIRTSLLLLLLGLAGTWLTGCASSSSSSSTTKDDRAFASRFSAFHYCKAPEIEQSTQRSCGAAALASVIQYWREDGTPKEKHLVATYPPQSEVGYPMTQLKDIATREHVLAFAVTLHADPMKQLSQEVRKGRPVITALELPKGRYFGGQIPLIETLDRRTVTGLGESWKSHYVVVMGDSMDNVLVMDPQYGYVTLSKTQFEQFWKKKGYAALVCSAMPSGVQVQ
jgi:predicted double-glycine peptidase